MSSSATDTRFASFLRRSLALLARERPDAYRALCTEGGSRVVALNVGGEQVSVVFGGRRAACRGGLLPAQVSVVTSRAAILAALDGEATLAELAVDGRLEIAGAVDDVLAFHDVLSLYVHGAVRARSFPTLLREFRAAQPTCSEEVPS